MVQEDTTPIQTEIKTILLIFIIIILAANASRGAYFLFLKFLRVTIMSKNHQSDHFASIGLMIFLICPA